MNTDSPRPLGEWLRQRREELDISLEKAEADTRIRLRYLEALESGEYDALPDPVVGRGFLRNYAAYLGLDPQEAAERFSGKAAPPGPEPPAAEESTPLAAGPFRPVALHEMPGRRSRWVWRVGVALIVVAALAGLVWWGYPYLSGWLARQGQAESASATATRPATAEGLATATRTPSATVAVTKATATTAVGATRTPRATRVTTRTPMPSPSVYTGIFLELVFADTSWIQVTVDGVRQFQGELEAETYRSWYGEERIELRIGNAGAVLVTVNGQSLGALGEPGEVIDRVFEKVGESVTEATVTPVPTTDGTPEPTTEPTEAPTATPTEEPVATEFPEPATATFTATAGP